MASVKCTGCNGRHPRPAGRCCTLLKESQQGEVKLQDQLMDLGQKDYIDEEQLRLPVKIELQRPEISVNLPFLPISGNMSLNNQPNKLRKSLPTSVDEEVSNEEKVLPKTQSPEILENRDVEFLVEGKIIVAIKAILCMISPILKTMLKGCFMESGLSKIPLPDKKYDDVVEFIEVTHLHRNITLANVFGILPIVHEYSCQPLLEKCEQVLMKKKKSLRLYSLADKYGLTKLCKKCLEDLPKEPYHSLMAREKPIYDTLGMQAKIDYLEATIEVQVPKTMTNSGLSVK